MTQTQPKCKSCNKNIYSYKVALRVMLRVHKQRGAEVRIYWCRKTRGYHLTSKPKLGR